MLLGNAVSILVRGGRKDDGDVPVSTLPQNFLSRRQRHLVIDENPGNSDSRKVTQGQGAIRNGALKGAASRGWVLSDYLANRLESGYIAGGLGTRGYGKITQCDAYLV